MKFEDFISARRFAREKKKEAGVTQVAPPAETKKERSALSPQGVDFLINLQTRSWRKEAQDYHKYAEAVWQEFIPQDRPEQARYFREFETNMIRGLHEINMRAHVYPEIKEALPALIEKFGDSVNKVVLWSTGDVSSTGFQISKIERSGVIMDFYKTLKDKLAKPEAKEFMREKTEYLVDDDKFLRLVEYVKRTLAENPDEPVKLVILEDTSTNFNKARTELEEALGESAIKKIKIIPVWASYSRYGRKGLEMARAKGREKEFRQTKKTLNAIDSFGDLISKKRFGKIFEDAHVFIDFDGVLSNDDARRKEQTQIVFDALADAAEKMGVGEEKLRKLAG